VWRLFSPSPPPNIDREVHSRSLSPAGSNGIGPKVLEGLFPHKSRTLLRERLPCPRGGSGRCRRGSALGVGTERPWSQTARHAGQSPSFPAATSTGEEDRPPRWSRRPMPPDFSLALSSPQRPRRAVCEGYRRDRKLLILADTGGSNSCRTGHLGRPNFKPKSATVLDSP
jgi:hypothetical protein